MQAMESGEVDGAMQGIAGMTASRPNWIPDGIVHVAWQLGLHPHELLPDVPAVGELGDDDLDRAALQLVASAAEIGRALFSTPDVPAERTKALRQAFDDMVADPDFIAAATERRFLLDPLSGEDLQDEVARQMDAPQEVIDRVRPYVVVE